MPRFSPLIVLLLLFSLVAAALAYRPGLIGPFVFDDGPNIVNNKAIAINDLNLETLQKAAFSITSGPLMRPISMVSFAGNYYLNGLNPYYFKLTNLLIHLFNGIGVFGLVLLIMNIYRERFEPAGLSPRHVQWLSLAIASAWLLHPLNLTSVLYIVQRMTSLSAFFSIWGMVLFLWGRRRLSHGNGGTLPILASLLLLTPLAAFSKESGAILPLVMLVAEIAFFKFQAKSVVSRRFLIGFYSFSVAIPAIIVLSYIVLNPDWLLAGYRVRGFTMVERIMTEARVLWFYIWQILLPSTAQLGLYHDDIAISKGLFKPVSTVLSLLGLSALFGVAWISRKMAPVITFGLLFFFAGHLLESTIYPLEIAHEHRNYFPMIGILIIFFFYLLYPLQHTGSLRLRQIVTGVLIGIFAFNTFSRANTWVNSNELFHTEYRHHPNSAIVNGSMGAVYSNIIAQDQEGMEQSYISARGYYEKAVSLDRGDTKALFGLLMLNASRAKTVEPEWIGELKHRLSDMPYAAIASDDLITLTECQLEGHCKLSNVDFYGLLQAALHNPTLSGPNRAKVLYAQSSYLINVAQDYPAAINVMHKMVQASPNEAEYRFALINFLVALQRFDEAKEQLSLVKQLGTAQHYSDEIASQEKILAEQESKN